MDSGLWYITSSPGIKPTILNNPSTQSFHITEFLFFFHQASYEFCKSYWHFTCLHLTSAFAIIFIQAVAQLREILTKTRHVCACLKVFLMQNPNNYSTIGPFRSAYQHVWRILHHLHPTRLSSLRPRHTPTHRLYTDRSYNGIVQYRTDLINDIRGKDT